MRQNFTIPPQHQNAQQEINQQVQEYLQQGGEIDVLPSHSDKTRPIGPVWHQERLDIQSFN